MHLVESGDATMTRGRLKRVAELVSGETFFFTYGDCVTDLDMTKLLEFHRAEDALATLTAIRLPGRFGELALCDETTRIERFREKPEGDRGWVNGGFFVLEPDVLDYIAGDETVWEREPLERLAEEGRLGAYGTTATGRTQTACATRWSSRSSGRAAARGGRPGSRPRPSLLRHTTRARVRRRG